jgi:hypothetical protein
MKDSPIASLVRIKDNTTAGKTHICIIHVHNGVGNRHPNVRALENSYASTSDRVVTTKREYMRLDWVCKSARME